MKLLKGLAVGCITGLLGAAGAQAQGWAPLAGPYDGSMNVVTPASSPYMAPVYGSPVSTGLVTVYAAGPTAGVPAATWTGPGCRPVAVPQPAPYSVAYAPAMTYRPAVTVNYVQPTVAYGSVPASAYPAGYAVQPVAAGPRVWVKPKVYVEGQPIRNLLRAITP